MEFHERLKAEEVRHPIKGPLWDDPASVNVLVSWSPPGAVTLLSTKRLCFKCNLALIVKHLARILPVLQEKKQQQLAALDSQYQAKIMSEVERYQALLQEKELLNHKWDEQNATLVEAHEKVRLSRTLYCPLGREDRCSFSLVPLHGLWIHCSGGICI